LFDVKTKAETAKAKGLETVGMDIAKLKEAGGEVVVL
jgi:hypothetical protein